MVAGTRLAYKWPERIKKREGMDEWIKAENMYKKKRSSLGGICWSISP